jgi:hypothetical protein
MSSILPTPTARPHLGGVERSTRLPSMPGASFPHLDDPARFPRPLTQVDDWEQFFREKSARRAKRERLRVIGPAIVWAVVVGTAVASAIAAVSAR